MKFVADFYSNFLVHADSNLMTSYETTLTLEELKQAHSELENHDKKCEKKCLLEMMKQFE